MIAVAMEVGMPMYVTQLEQIFGSQCAAYSVEDIMSHGSQASNSCLAADKGSHDHPEVPVENEFQERTTSASVEENVDAPCEMAPTLDPKDAKSVEPGTASDFSSDEIRSKLESFLEKRDTSLETKLKELFDAAETKTAKESLLLSLR